MKKILIGFTIALGLLLGVASYGNIQVYGELIAAMFEKLSSDPTGTEGRVYYNTTEKTAKIYNGTSWTGLGGSGGGSGINFIEDGDAESGTDSCWTIYNDGPVAEPVDGTGGTITNFEFANINVNSIRGSRLFDVRSTIGLSKQGYGVSCSFNTDIADGRSGNKIAFSAETTQASNVLTSGDYTFHIYDVVNASFVPVSESTVTFDTSGDPNVYKFYSTFIPRYNSFSYRAIFHRATTTTTTERFRFDNVSIGPEDKIIGSAGGWKSYDVTVNGGANSNCNETGSTLKICTNDASDTLRKVQYQPYKDPVNGTWRLRFNASVNINSPVTSRNMELNGVEFDNTHSLYVSAANDGNGASKEQCVAIAQDGGNTLLITCDLARSVLMVSGDVPLTGKPTWADYDNTINLMRADKQSPVKAGMVMAWPSDSLPTGWLEADGTSLLVADYPDLFSAIGYKYGGSGANFNIPDYRGYFLRGQNNGSGNDPDAGSRTDRGDGVAGDNVGTKQSDATAKNGLGLSWSSTNATTYVNKNLWNSNQNSHYHYVDGGPGTGNLSQPYDIGKGSGGHTNGRSGNASVTWTSANAAGTVNKNQWNSSQSWVDDSETRPTNINVKWIIKAWDDSADTVGFGSATSSSKGLVSAEHTYPVSYSDMTFTSASGTWTVDSGDVQKFDVYRVGKRVFIDFRFITTSNSAGSDWNRVLIPTSVIPASGTLQTDSAGLGYFNGGSATDRRPTWIYLNTTGSNVSLYIARSDGGSSINISTNLNYFYGQISYLAE